MKKTALALFLSFTATVAHAGIDCQEKLDSRVRLSGPNLSLAELQKAGTDLAARNPKAPQVPFAHSNANWRHVVAMYRQGDQIRAFELLAPDGTPFVWGFALIRGQCVVETIMTAIS